MTTTTMRANKITVTNTDGILMASYWRTHKNLATFSATELGFEVNEELNSTANRELFRVHAISTASEHGIAYDPADRRADTNRFPTHWVDESQVAEWAERMVRRTADEWASKLGVKLTGITLIGLTDEIRYENKDSIKSARVELEVLVTDSTDEIGMLTTLEIRSGQMTKPLEILGRKWNATNFGVGVAEYLTLEESDKLEDQTVSELKEMAKSDGLEIKGISKLKKSDLIKAINKARTPE